MKMNYKNILRDAAICCLAAAFTGCTDNDGMDEALQIYQEYEVLLEGNFKAGYANFRVGTAAGDRVELTNGSNLTINALATYYVESISEDDPPFNYSVQLDSNHNKAVFRFTRSKNRVLVNEVSFDDVPVVSFTGDIAVVYNNEPVQINLGNASELDVKAYLVRQSATSASNGTYEGYVRPDGNIIFSGVPAEVYDLIVDVEKVMPTVQNDYTAGGSIKTIRRIKKGGVKVVIPEEDEPADKTDPEQ